MSGQQPEEWVGARVPFSASIASLADHPALLVLWVELPSMQVVAHTLEDPSKPAVTFGQSLMRAMSSPMVGAPRRPRRVRVADPALAHELSSFSFVKVELAPTPEIDAVVRSLDSFVGKGSYFSDPVIAPRDIAALFEASGPLWSVKPWEHAEDGCLIEVQVPALGLAHGCVSIVGALHDVYGFVLFPSIEDHRRMIAAAQRTGTPEPYEALFFSFDFHDDVPEAMREEVAAHGWPLADEDAYPVLMRMVEGRRAPVTHRDLRLATLVMRALTELTSQHAETLEEYGTHELCGALTGESETEILYTVPHPDVVLVEQAPRAPTLGGVDNPYQLSLSRPQLKRLEQALGEFSLHRLIGLYCGLASAPGLISPTVWLPVVADVARFPSHGAFALVSEPLLHVYHEVLGRLRDDDLDALVPVAQDERACREWARGFELMFRLLGPGQLEDDELLDSVFEIQALAGIPQILSLLDEHCGDQTRAEALQQFRLDLADTAAHLYEGWAPRRQQAV
jgi:hypothetical protein